MHHSHHDHWRMITNAARVRFEARGNLLPKPYLGLRLERRYFAGIDVAETLSPRVNNEGTCPAST
jgi:hypothetical protein